MKTNIMTNGILFAALLIASGIPVAQARDLAGDEINTLFSGKTIFSHHEKKGFDIVTFYAPDGSLRMLRKDEVWSGIWRVDSKGNMCLTLKDPYSGVPKNERCSVISEDKGVYKKYKVKGNGIKVHLITYTKFVKGNQEGL